MPRRRKTRSTLPAHIHAVKVRGREYFYYQPNRGARAKGPRTPLPGHPYNGDGTPSERWWAHYRAVADVSDQCKTATDFSALIAAYKASPEWSDLGARTKVEWARDLTRIEKVWGFLAVTGLEPKHVLKLRDQHAATPAAANNLIKALSAMITWAIPRGWRSTNPCAHIKKLKIGEGYAPWSWKDIEYFRNNARADLWHAAALALYSGQRLGDVLRMRWDDVENGLIAVTQRKTGKKLWIPTHAHLRNL